MGDRLRRGGCRDQSRREQRFANRCHLHLSLPLAFDLASFGTAYYGSAIKRRASGTGMQQSLTESLPADQQGGQFLGRALAPEGPVVLRIADDTLFDLTDEVATVRSEEHTSELQSLMRISYSVF